MIVCSSGDMAASRTNSKVRTADVIIVGGGLVGGTLGCALAEAGQAVLVVDRADPAQLLDSGFDGRASAIAQATQQMLAQVGVWSLIADQGAPISEIRVADGSSPLFLHYDHADIGDQPLGYMVENRHLRRAVFDRLAESPDAIVLAPAAIQEFEIDSHAAALTLVDGTVLRAPLLVGADGRTSAVREFAGIKLNQWRYAQTGIVCTVAHERPHLNIAHEHFLPSGPFAILPLSGNRSSIVWTEKSDLAPAIMQLPDDEFTDELARRFGDFLGALTVLEPRWSYPLALQFAEGAVASRLALAGDAAHALHPIAGQGLNMGLRDVAALAEVIVDARRLGLDVGSGAVLERYQRWRRFDNLLIAGLTDGLNRLFSNDIAPVRQLRDVGLAVVNRAGPLKRYFMRHAMGRTGNVPRLMRGEAL